MRTSHTGSTAVVTLDSLTRQLLDCGLHEGQTVLVHTALSRLGWVVGGAETVVRALFRVVGPSGTLMVPTQTWKHFDAAKGVPWAVPEGVEQLVRNHWPAYDPAVTPSIGMGKVAEMIRTWPSAVRSPHPVLSLTAVGPNARILTAEQDLEDVYGNASPLGKLYDLGGHVLLLGVGHDKSTSLHLAETRASYPGKRNIQEDCAMVVAGERKWVTYKTLELHDEDFNELGHAYEEEHDLPSHRVGQTDARFLELAPFIDWAVNWMEQNRDFASEPR
jgi:aminoglycoside 3-N-acetyltransferase